MENEGTLKFTTQKVNVGFKETQTEEREGDMQRGHTAVLTTAGGTCGGGGCIGRCLQGKEHVSNHQPATIFVHT